ncbi:hypothetical protein Q9L58_010971, partial [Maublancomyces gigas]
MQKLRRTPQSNRYRLPDEEKHQGGLMKNQNVMLSLLDSSINTADIVIIQEPYIFTASPGSWSSVSHPVKL